MKMLTVMALLSLSFQTLADSKKKIVCESEFFDVTIVQDFDKSTVKVSSLNKDTRKTLTETAQMTCWSTRSRGIGANGRPGPFSGCASEGNFFQIKTESDANGMYALEIKDTFGELKDIQFDCYL